ncbi:ferrochelatase [Propionivibrio limicola]|uniref:ferrochelatase n=1 Tax=Propionivibrio limicola TaxID=167645 RepID=UPI0012919C6E|nr:ferrochelatase [Propionivibrio limicola]
MSGLLPEPAHQGSKNGGKTGVLLINLGTPDEPTTPAVRRYLKEFLADPRVVEIPKLLWWPILNGIILNLRPARSAKKYASVWMPEGSPLKVHTERQTKLLRGYLGADGESLVVDYAMRYGSPSIPAVLDRLKASGCTRILLLPLYPQYSASTTATAFDAAFGWMRTARSQPEIRTVRSFADDPGYIAALAASVRSFWQTNGRPEPGSRLLMSFHGIPRFAIDKGDTYRDECVRTGRCLAEALNLNDGDYQICYQSRFGRAEWLQPYTAQTLQQLPGQGIRHVDILCPGFPADCLETLEEIAIEGKTTFLGAGGKSYRYIPCLNENDAWIRALSGLIQKHLNGWPD